MNSNYPTSIDVVVGGQFGSEAKGHVTQQVIESILTDVGAVPQDRVVNVRVAGPNAGHTVVNRRGVALALRTIPVGVVYDDVLLYIAAGSEVDLEVLERELVTVTEAGHDVSGRLFVSEQATLLSPEHVYRETGMHERMGSTGKGIGAARADRLMRTATLIGQSDEARSLLARFGAYVINENGESDLYALRKVVIEGTQGYGLGLHAGFYPQCTSSDCRPIDFLAMANLDPTFVGNRYTPWVVLRPYPIRVAGNSGPLAYETDWEDLGLEPEFTTVTKKMRRVGGWDERLALKSIRAAGPTAKVAFTMFDQIMPEAAGLHNGINEPFPAEWSQEMHDRVVQYQRSINHPIRLVTTSPSTAVWR